MKKPEEDQHVLVQLSRAMGANKVTSSLVIKTEEDENSAHVWQTTHEDYFVLFKKGKKFTDFTHFNGNSSFNKAKAFAKTTLLQLLKENRDVNALC